MSFVLVIAACGSTPAASDAHLSEPAPATTPAPAPTAAAGPIVFSGTVVSIEPIGRRGGTALLVDADPRFVLAMRIATVSSVDAPFRAGSDQAFAIHSPTRLFQGDNVVGQAVELRLTGGPRVWALARAR